MVFQKLWKENPPLLVRGHFLGPREELSLEPSHVLIVEGDRVHQLDDSAPFLFGVSHDAALEPAVEEEAASLSHQKIAKRRRDTHPAFFVNRMPVLAVESSCGRVHGHRRAVPPLFRSTSQVLPLVPTLVKRKVHGLCMA